MNNSKVQLIVKNVCIL